MPLNTIALEDIGKGAARFDAWLQSASGGLVTLERIKTVAGSLPVVGNIIALVDALGDVVTLVRTKSQNFLDWVSLGINLIGVLPAPPTMAAARMSLRPTLALVRQELRQAAKAALGDGIIEVLVGHLNATIIGEIDDFVAKAQAKLATILNDAGVLGEKMVLEVAGGLEKVALGKLNAAGNAQTAVSQAREGASQLLHDPKKAIGNFLNATWNAYKAAGKAVVNTAVKVGMPAEIRQTVVAHVGQLRTMGPVLRAQMTRLADPRLQHSIGWLLSMLVQAVAAWRKRKGNHQAANVHPKQTSQARKTGHEGELEVSSHQAPAKASPGCKNCPAPAGSTNSISFAMGDETLSHTDFVLPGLFPIDWARTYRSSLGVYDGGEQGARWITPYTTRFDVIRKEGQEALRYHAADGRSHDYPLPAVGKFHHDPIDNVTLVRVSENGLTLARGFESQETYRRHGQRFRLTGITLRSGAGVALHYDHRIDGDTVLSDVIAYQGETVFAHVGVRPDAKGRIAELWQIADSKLVRQLSRYTYDDAGDLTMAQDENAAHWEYTYQHHLVTRYTDRTGRGMNLQWQGDGPDARAVREWADDGSFDTRLEWDENIRLTYVTDAHGNETWHYYDILGYTYRIQHPDGLSEWFFRDHAKNVVKHVHTDGAVDRYAYDERGNLVEHIRPDDSVVHYAWDDKDQLIKIRDAEGGLWLRDYDIKGNLTEEIDPLGHKTAYAYNKSGLPVEITDAKGGKKQLAFTATGQLASYTDCSGKTSAWKYGERGELVRFTDAAGNATQYHYEAGQLASVTHPDQRVERFERDAEGRLLVHTDALHRRTAWRYNEVGLIAERTDAAGQTLGYRWDRLGRLATLTNENSASTEFQYDPVGRLLRESGFDGKTTEYNYDPASGLLDWTVDSGQLMTDFVFDAMGRLTRRRAGLIDADNRVPHVLTETFAYNGNGRLILAENADSRLQWFHDAAGNVVREHQHYRCLKEPLVAVWRHEYDALNQRIATVRPDGHRVGVLTYGSGHVHGVMLDDRELVQFERDNLHREIARTQGNRLAQSQVYDPAGRLLEQTLSHVEGAHAGQRMLRREYQYDAAGQLSSIRDLRRGTLQYRYDPVGRLLEANSALGVETFDFDPAGNLLHDPDTRVFKADPARGRPEFHSRLQGRPKLVDNLLKQYAGTHYEWDERGNLSLRVVNGVHERFAWDAFNRLVGWHNPKVEVRYRYDALGRRLSKSSSANYFENQNDGEIYRRNERARLNQEYGCAFTLYGWDGDQLAWESRQEPEAGVGDHFRIIPGAERTTHYLYEPGSLVPLAQAVRREAIDLLPEPAWEGDYDLDDDPLWTREIAPQPFEALAWYQCDHLGTPQELTDEAGELAWSAQYKAWGAAQEAISNAARKAGIQNPLRFQGQYYDHENGLHYNRHRYYDPGTGRFVSKDPIGLAGGLNLNQYAPNPISWVDPLGLACSQTRRASLREVRRQLGIPMSQQPTSQKMVPLTDSSGAWILGNDKHPIMTRELTYQLNGKNVIIQDHSAGHYYNEGGVGDQPSHHNVRPEDNTRTGKVDGMDDHYHFNCRNKK
ncbi:RHS family protein [Cupriavidus sp. GA3-3]|nr:RHS family protein [Cupriavidus sp. GA3-3]